MISQIPIDTLNLPHRIIFFLKESNINTIDNLCHLIDEGIYKLMELPRIRFGETQRILSAVTAIGYPTHRAIDKHISHLLKPPHPSCEDASKWSDFKSTLYNYSTEKISEAAQKKHVATTEKLRRYPNVVIDYYYWLLSLNKDLRTIVVYIDNILRFISYMYSYTAPNDFYHSIEPHNITDYIDSLPSQSYKATNWTSLKSFFDYLHKINLCENPVILTKRPIKEDKVDLTYLTPDETNIMFNNVRRNANPRMKNRDLCILMLGFYCGFKSDDIVNANIDDISWRNKTISLTSSSEYPSNIPLTNTILSHLSKWLSDRNDFFSVTSNALFVSQEKHRISQRTLWDLVKKYSIGIDKNVTPRVMRNTGAINLYLATNDLQLCSNYLNHKNLSTTTRYIQKLTSKPSTHSVTSMVESIYNKRNNSDTTPTKKVLLTHRQKCNIIKDFCREIAKINRFSFDFADCRQDIPCSIHCQKHKLEMFRFERALNQAINNSTYLLINNLFEFSDIEITESDIIYTDKNSKNN